MKKFIAGAATAALLAGIAAVVPATAGTALARVTLGPSTVAWRTCADAYLASKSAECALLPVPLDYAKPTGRKIKVAISRVLHTSSPAAFQGVMLVNPGGPGASGLQLSTLGQYVPHGAGDVYDWIGFDPRGVGSSIPALSCKPNYFGYNRPEYVPTTKSLRTQWRKRSKSYADACQKAQPALLEHIKTIDSVRDMESIRKALGAPQINYYGLSYGTYLGAVYGTKYPSKVRRMVLDGNVDPRRVWYKANLDQDVAFDKNITIWFAWVAKYDRVYHLGRTEKSVETKYYAELKRLDKRPAHGKIGSAEWNDIFVYAGYYQSVWERIAGVFSAWINHGDYQALKDEYDADAGIGDDNGFAVYTAVQCTDAAWPSKWSTWQKDSNRIYKKAKFLTWNNAWYNAPCLYWHAKSGTPVNVNGSKVQSALLISETKDAATPFEGSLELRRRLPHSSLIAEPGGTTHAGSLSGNACVDNAIADYLLTGKRPVRQHWRGPDQLCRPLPPPVPTSAPALVKKSAVPTVRDLLLGRV